MPSEFESQFNKRVKQASGEEYRRVREEQGLSQQEAADRLGFCLRNYQKLEKGDGTASLTKHLSNIFNLMVSHISNISKPTAMDMETILQRLVAPRDGDSKR